MEIFQCFRGHDLLTNEFSINGFQKPLQLTEIIVELPFMWKLSSIYCKYANYLKKLRGSYYNIRLLFHHKCGQPLTIQNFHNFQKFPHNVYVFAAFSHVCQQGYKLVSTIIKIWWLELFTMIRVLNPYPNPSRSNVKHIGETGYGSRYHLF